MTEPRRAHADARTSLRPAAALVRPDQLDRAPGDVPGDRRPARPVAAETRQWGTHASPHVGRKTGKERVAILGYFEDGPNVVTLAMNGWGEAGAGLVAQPPGAAGRRRSS